WDGTQWSALGLGIGHGFPDSVYSIAMQGSNLYVGGEFTNAGPIAVANIMKWDGHTWSSVGAGAYTIDPFGQVAGSVRALTVSGSEIYAGGAFTTAGTTPVNNLAKWDGNGWAALGSGLDGFVFALAVQGPYL